MKVRNKFTGEILNIKEKKLSSYWKKYYEEINKKKESGEE